MRKIINGKEVIVPHCVTLAIETKSNFSKMIIKCFLKDLLNGKKLHWELPS